jgi:type I restriction enzyme R subunit
VNDLFDGEHPESSVRAVITHVKDRLEESETLQQQAKHNTLAQFSASPDLQQQFAEAVLAAMDSSADLSTQILGNPDIFQKLLAELIPIVYKDLAATG